MTEARLHRCRRHTGRVFSTLTSSEYFPFGPDYGEQLDDWHTASSTAPLITGLQGKDNTGQDYGSWIQGYIEAPTTGAYLFCLASADNSELWLNTNSSASYNSSNAVLIAYEPGTGEVLFTGNRLETRLSAPINLVQGQKYYFEVLHQHGGGAGYIQVGWQRPDGVQEIIPALHLAQYEDNYYTQVSLRGLAPIFNVASGVSPGGYLGGDITNAVALKKFSMLLPVFSPGGYLGGDITNAVALKEGAELLLPLDILAQQPTTFVWKTNGVVVPGQNLSYFDISHISAAYNGVHIQAFVTNAFGGLASSVATVTVAADTTPPTILTADTAVIQTGGSDL